METFVSRDLASSSMASAELGIELLDGVPDGGGARELADRGDGSDDLELVAFVVEAVLDYLPDAVLVRPDDDPQREQGVDAAAAAVLTQIAQQYVLLLTHHRRFRRRHGSLCSK